MIILSLFGHLQLTKVCSKALLDEVSRKMSVPLKTYPDRLPYTSDSSDGMCVILVLQSFLP